MKLNNLVYLCTHYLIGNNAYLLKVDPEIRARLITNLNAYDPSYLVSISTPNKIVIYTTFLLLNIYIQHVLELNGIKSLLFIGIWLVIERTANLEKFKKSKHKNPHILIILNIGLYRLNIMCANILFVVVSDSELIYY